MSDASFRLFPFIFYFFDNFQLLNCFLYCFVSCPIYIYIHIYTAAPSVWQRRVDSPVHWADRSRSPARRAWNRSKSSSSEGRTAGRMKRPLVTFKRDTGELGDTGDVSAADSRRWARCRTASSRSPSSPGCRCPPCPRWAASGCVCSPGTATPTWPPRWGRSCASCGQTGCRLCRSWTRPARRPSSDPRRCTPPLCSLRPDGWTPVKSGGGGPSTRGAGSRTGVGVTWDFKMTCRRGEMLNSLWYH